MQSIFLKKHIFLLVILVLSISACKTSKRNGKDAYRTKWSCNSNQVKDYEVSMTSNEIFADLHITEKNFNKSIRVKTDLQLPTFVEDIISINELNEIDESKRLMRGYVPMRVCGDFYTRNKAVYSDGVSIFTDFNINNRAQLFKWQITYINKNGEIKRTQKTLAIKQH